MDGVAVAGRRADRGGEEAMSPENVELVRRVYEGGAEVERLLREGRGLAGQPWLALWRPECVIEELADAPDTAAYHGREGVVRYFQLAFTDVWDEWIFTPVEIVEGPMECLRRSTTGAGRRREPSWNSECFRCFAFETA